MTIVRRLARPLLAASFVASGVDAVRRPGATAEVLRPVAARLAPATGLPDDPQLLARANGAVMVGAGTLLALGRMPRLSALALAATLLPTTYAEQAFWAEKDPAARADKRALFLRNAGLLGGVLLAAVDTEGRPGLAWLGRRAVQDVDRAGRRTGRRARRQARRTAREARRTAREAKLVARTARRTAGAELGQALRAVG